MIISSVNSVHNSTQTMPSPTPDTIILRDKRRHYGGRARIFLDRLDYHGISSRSKVDQKHVDKLTHIYQTEGCMRLHDPEYYVPGLITSEDLKRAVSYSGLRLLDLGQEGEPPILNLPENIRIRILHGEHRLRAAELFLEPRERWWVVVLYTTGRVSSHET